MLFVQKIPERFQVSNFLVFYLIHSLQMGVGVLGFQRVVAKTAENDAWIAVIMAGIGIHIILWMIYGILDKGNGDITDIHRAIFGKWIGKMLSSLFIVYFILLAVTVLRTYIEIIQVWVFPVFNTWLFSIAFLGLVFYIVSGGFRIVTGIAFLGVVLPLYLILTFIYPIEFSFFENLLPIWDHSVKEMLLSAKDVTLSLLGFEALLLYYPFLKDPTQSKKWAHGGVLLTTTLYLLAMIVSLSYFSPEQLEKNIWASLSILKIVQLPFVERVEYIGIASWIIVILPNVCIALWASSRIAKRIFKRSQRSSLILILMITLIIVNQLKTRQQVNFLNELTANTGFYLLYVYIPILFAISFIYYKLKEKKET
jgi:spore germination protein AB